MLHILLLLLKIAGTVLLVLLGLILLVLLIILFVPIHYNVSVRKYTALAAEVRASWICHFFGFLFSYDMQEEQEKRMHIRLRVAWLSIFDNQRQKKQRIKDKHITKTKKSHTNKHPEEKTQTEKETLQREAEPEKKLQQSSVVESHEKKTQQSPVVEPHKKTQQAETEDSASSKKKKVPKWREISEKISYLSEKKDRLLAVYHEEKNHEWFWLTGHRLKQLLIRLMPQIDRLLWHFGFHDPATTGKALGFLSIFYPTCKERMVLQPEFEQEIMEGEAVIHGRIRLWQIVFFMIRSFLNRQFFGIVKEVKAI